MKVDRNKGKSLYRRFIFFRPDGRVRNMRSLSPSASEDSQRRARRDSRRMTHTVGFRRLLGVTGLEQTLYKVFESTTLAKSIRVIVDLAGLREKEYWNVWCIIKGKTDIYGAPRC